MRFRKQNRTRGLATAASAGWPRASSTPWPRSRFLPSATGCATTTASSARIWPSGYQVEQPDPWLSRPDPWEVMRPGETVSVPLASGLSPAAWRDRRRARPADAHARHPLRPARWSATAGKTINTLRLWKAGTRIRLQLRRVQRAATSSARCRTRFWPSPSPASSTRTTRRRAAGRCGSSRNTSSSAARWPTSSPGSASAETTGPRCRTRSRSS